MFGTALRLGLRGWARTPIKAGFGTTVTLGLLVLAYALVIEFSPDFWTSAALLGLLANLAFCGWIWFCVGLVSADAARLSALLAGFRKPFGLTAVGLCAAGVILLVLLILLYLVAISGLPRSVAWLAVLLGFCLTAPMTGFVMLEAMSGTKVEHALARGVLRAFGHWPALAALALLTFGLVAAGPLPGLLLEGHALTQIAALLPTEFAEYDLAIVRLVALLGGITSMSAAGCVWAAAWCVSPEGPPPTGRFRDVPKHHGAISIKPGR